MTLRYTLAGPVRRLRFPKTTVRWRLTLLYGGLFLICGATLLAVTYTLVAHATVTRGPGRFIVDNPGKVPPRPGFGNVHVRVPPGALPPGFKQVLGSSAGRAAVRFVGSQQRIADLHQLEVESAIALAIMAIISAMLGWLVAGRVLRPLRTITATTQEISEANLHRRLALDGPRDEFKTLADTIDGLLGRLQASFDSQRRFVANASHELRTPLTASRALLEMIVSDPDATVETFCETCREVLEESEHQEQLIDALLALAHGQRGIDHREPLDLALIAGEVLRTHDSDAAARGLTLDVSLEPVVISGDRRLIERLASNLLENALRHNATNGSVRVRVGMRDGKATLVVANTGPLVPAGEVERLLQPFQRLAPDRTSNAYGLGLGLSIVAAIAAAHDAALDVKPGADGGLDVELRFPPASDSNLQTTPDDTSPLQATRS